MVETEKVRRFRLDWLIYVPAAVALVGLLIQATRSELSRNPSREATVDLGSYGLITIRFSTNPYPPLPTGTVNLSFMPMNSRGRPLLPLTAWRLNTVLPAATSPLVPEWLSR